jgi:hypothetical protein
LRYFQDISNLLACQSVDLAVLQAPYYSEKLFPHLAGVSRHKEATMKLRALKLAMALTGVFLFTGILYAANNDRSINGNDDVGLQPPKGQGEIKGPMKSDRYFGVDTANPAGKAEISNNKDVNGKPRVGTNTPEEK